MNTDSISDLFLACYLDFLKELKGLIKTLDDQDSQVIDQELVDKDIKPIWKTRIASAVQDWTQTLEWSSPDFNPKGLNKLSKEKKEDKQSNNELTPDEKKEFKNLISKNISN